MIYFKLTSAFTLPSGQPGTNIFVLDSEDSAYQKTLDDAIIVSRATAKRICNNIEPEITNTITTLTLAQFNAIIKPTGYTTNTAQDIDANITDLEQELNEETPPDVIPE
jgi:hypothetical protein